MFFLSRFKIYGHSMEPTFHEGENVIISNILYIFIDPKIGDVIVFQDKKTSKYIIKRIIKIQNRKYFVKGDNIKDNKIFSPISKEKIVGKVIYKI